MSCGSKASWEVCLLLVACVCPSRTPHFLPALLASRGPLALGLCLGPALFPRADWIDPQFWESAFLISWAYLPVSFTCLERVGPVRAWALSGPVFLGPRCGGLRLELVHETQQPITGFPADGARPRSVCVCLWAPWWEGAAPTLKVFTAQRGRQVVKTHRMLPVCPHSSRGTPPPDSHQHKSILLFSSQNLFLPVVLLGFPALLLPPTPEWISVCFPSIAHPVQRSALSVLSLPPLPCAWMSYGHSVHPACCRTAGERCAKCKCVQICNQ